MLFEVEKDVWFDNENIYIVKGKENLNNYLEHSSEIQPTTFKSKSSDNPFPIITFLSSTKCNLQCKYCYADKGNYYGVSEINTFTLKNYIKVYETVLKEYGGVNQICFFGGEPLIGYQAIKSFVEYLYKTYPTDSIPGLAVGSNGTIMNEDIRDFLIKYNICFSTSLDGPKELNDISRVGKGIPSVYDKVKSTLEFLDGIPALRVLQFTFGKDHIKSYKPGEAVKWAKLMSSLPIQYYEIVAVTNDDPEYKIDLEDKDIREKFIMLCEELADYCLGLLISQESLIMPSVFVSIITSIAKRKKNSGCGAGKNITITPDMKIYPCHTFITSEREGIACEPNFRQVIKNNNEYQRLISLSREGIPKCDDCIAKSVCHVFCKGMQKDCPDKPHEERCLMMLIFLKKSISFLANDFPLHKDVIMDSIRKNLSIRKASAINAKVK
jgi:uncharacterized protein